jgi:hypothetical protein
LNRKVGLSLFIAQVGRRNLTPAREIGFYTILVGKNGPEPAVDQVISSLHDLPDRMPGLWQNDP